MLKITTVLEVSDFSTDGMLVLRIRRDRQTYLSKYKDTIEFQLSNTGVRLYIIYLITIVIFILRCHYI